MTKSVSPIGSSSSASIEAIRASARQLIESGVNERVVIHAAEGGYTVDKKGREAYQPSLKLPSKFIAGTAGAGDAFCAGVLYGLYNEWAIAKSLKLAVCAGAACLSEPTTTAGMQPLCHTLALAKQYPFTEDLLGKTK